MHPGARGLPLFHQARLLPAQKGGGRLLGLGQRRVHRVAEERRQRRRRGGVGEDQRLGRLHVSVRHERRVPVRSRRQAQVAGVQVLRRGGAPGVRRRRPLHDVSRAAARASGPDRRGQAREDGGATALKDRRSVPRGAVEAGGGDQAQARGEDVQSVEEPIRRERVRSRVWIWDAVGAKASRARGWRRRGGWRTPGAAANAGVPSDELWGALGGEQRHGFVDDPARFVRRRQRRGGRLARHPQVRSGALPLHGQDGGDVVQGRRRGRHVSGEREHVRRNEEGEPLHGSIAVRHRPEDWKRQDRGLARGQERFRQRERGQMRPGWSIGRHGR
mmetsp:Transcript_1196/g.4465  ORF Transcript_1196/g.4465 Transcript_1196/m.4465 type:complete len:331 (-) Transcript_1196:2438-3430(-)